MFVISAWCDIALSILFASPLLTNSFNIDHCIKKIKRNLIRINIDLSFTLSSLAYIYKKGFINLVLRING